MINMMCDECKGTENTFDETLGERVCDNCGLVLVQEMFEETVHILDSTGNVRHSSDKGKLGSVISGKGSYKFNRFGKNSVMPPHIQKGLSHCNMVLSHVAPHISLKERIEQMYLQLHNKGIFGRSQIEARATAVVYYALRENGTPHAFDDVMGEFNPNQRSVKKLIRKINQHYRNEMNYKPINPQYLLEQTLVKITDDIEFRRQCIKVLEFFEPKVEKSTFNKGRSYYVSIIWIAAKMNLNSTIKDRMLSERTGFSRWVIWRQTKAILSLVGLENATQVKGKQLSELGE